MKLAANIEGTKELQNRFGRSPLLIQQAAREMLQVATFIAEGAAKEKAPIDHGILRGSIHSKLQHFNNELVGVVGTNVEYAPFQEHGTGIYGPNHAPITPKRGKFLVFKSKSGRMIFARSVRGTRPKRFMAQGMKAVQNNMGKIRQAGILAVKKKLGF